MLHLFLGADVVEGWGICHKLERMVILQLLNWV